MASSTSPTSNSLPVSWLPPAMSPVSRSSRQTPTISSAALSISSLARRFALSPPSPSLRPPKSSPAFPPAPLSACSPDSKELPAVPFAPPPTTGILSSRGPASFAGPKELRSKIVLGVSSNLDLPFLFPRWPLGALCGKTYFRDETQVPHLQETHGLRTGRGLPVLQRPMPPPGSRRLGFGKIRCF